AGRVLKVAEHTGGRDVTDPSHLRRDVDRSDIDPVEQFLRECLPGVSPTICRHRVCMYTLTPDRHFIVDVHPQFPNVVIAAGFSGHGFKFTSVLGEAMADLALCGRTDLPIGFLSLSRFGESPS
ncbi:MAG: FAD-dependent oxidoreductase, partial [Planctomycetes bacterium]|nr:FAD-dependent oxidoreductase [Planctomycetota bacterium]